MPLSKWYDNRDSDRYIEVRLELKYLVIIYLQLIPIQMTLWSLMRITYLSLYLLLFSLVFSLTRTNILYVILHDSLSDLNFDVSVNMYLFHIINIFYVFVK